MTTFNSIWTTSLNQASLLQKSNSKLSLGGINSVSSSSGTGLLGPINMAKGQQGPLDILLSVVGKSVSDVMSAYKPTQGMSFANSFKSAFSLSPFQQTSMNITNSIASNSISNLSKGIFSEATSAMSMSRQEKESLMTTLLSGVNLGFLNSKSLLQSQGLLTEMIHESLNNLQNNVQTNVGGYYDSVMGNSLNIYGTQTNAAIAPPPSITTPLVTTPPAITTTEITTPDTTTTVTTPDTTTIAAEIETPQEDVTEIAEEVDGGTSNMPAPGLLDDPYVMKIIDSIRNSAHTFGSGTHDVVLDDGFFKNKKFTYEINFMMDGEGKAHDVIQLHYETLSHYNDNLLIDGHRVNVDTDPEQYIESLAPYSIKDGAGNLHTLKNVTGDGHAVELDGVKMTSEELLKWAEDNGLEQGTPLFSYNNEVKFFKAEVQTEYGTYEKNIVTEYNDGTAKSFYEKTDLYMYGADSAFYFKTKDGAAHYLQTDIYSSSGGWTETILDGQEMNSEDLAQWAEDNGLEKVSFTENGVAYEAWYADMIKGDSTQKFEFTHKVDGVAYGRDMISSMNVSTNDGEIHKLAFKYNTTYIDGIISSDSQVSELIKSSTNLEKISFAYDGAQYDSYFADLSYMSNFNYVINASTGEHADIYTSKTQLYVEGTGVKEHISFDNSGNTVNSSYVIDGNTLSIEEFKDWAVNNGITTTKWTASDGTVYTEYLGNRWKSSGATTALFAEADGKLYNISEYYKIKPPFNYGSPIALDMNGDGIQTVSAEEGVQFDLLGNGQSVQTGWTAGGDDAFLALDRDNSGAIESGKELFGNQHGAANGYEELAKFDDNNDGVIDSRDKVFSNLKLWNDSNMNGVSEAGELRTLAQAGVASISTGFKTSSFVDAAGNQHRQVSSFTKTNGQSAVTTDLWFRYYGITSYINNQYPTAR